MEKTSTKSPSISKPGKVFIISLVILILSSLLNWGAVTRWGDIDITEVSIVGDNGHEYTALMYVPSNATHDTPAPGLFTMMGASGNARNHEVYALEYARRGFVVLSIDNCGSGDATYDPTIYDLSKTNVAIPLWKYFIECPLVDPERTVISGHSVGSTGALHMSAWFNPTVCVAVDGFFGIYPSEDEKYYTGMICAICGAGDNQNSDEYLMPMGDLFRLDERITMDGEFQYDTLYGSFEDQSAKAMYFTPSGHEDAMINPDGMAIQLDFVQQAMEVPNPLPGNDQVWIWKDVFGLVGMFAFAFTLIALALLLINQVNWFSSIMQPLPRNIGLRGKGLAISVTCALVLPVLILKTGSFGLSSVFMESPLFDMGNASRAFAVVVGLAIIGLLTLVLFIFTDGKKHHATLREYGLTSEGCTKLNFSLIGKSFVLSLVVLFVGFAYLRLQREVLGTDFYCLYFGFRPIAWNKFIYYVPYIIVWVLCFIVAALGMNVERRLPSTGSETKDTVIALVVNVFLAIITLTIVLFLQQYLQKHVLFRTAAALGTWGADLTRLWGMPAGLTIGTFGNTYLYRKTGSVWPGVFLMGILCALACVLYGSHGAY